MNHKASVLYPLSHFPPLYWFSTHTDLQVSHESHDHFHPRVYTNTLLFAWNIFLSIFFWRSLAVTGRWEIKGSRESFVCGSCFWCCVYFNDSHIFILEAEGRESKERGWRYRGRQLMEGDSWRGWNEKWDASEEMNFVQLGKFNGKWARSWGSLALLVSYFSLWNGRPSHLLGCSEWGG